MQFRVEIGGELGAKCLQHSSIVHPTSTTPFSKTNKELSWGQWDSQVALRAFSRRNPDEIGGALFQQVGCRSSPEDP